MFKVKTFLNSYSGDGKSDICELMHQWVFSWHKTATATAQIKKLMFKYNRKTIKDLVNFALTYEKPTKRKFDNRDLDGTMSELDD